MFNVPQRWIAKTYSQQFLWRVVAVFAVLIVGGAYVVDAVHLRIDGPDIRKEQAYNHDLVDMIDDEFAGWDPNHTIHLPEDRSPAGIEKFVHDLPTDQMCDLLVDGAEYQDQDTLAVIKLILAMDEKTEPRMVLYHALWQSLDSKATEPDPALTAMLNQESVMRHAWYAAGIFREYHQQYAQAVDCYLHEASFPDAELARQCVVYLCLEYGMLDRLHPLINDPLFEPLLSVHDRMTLYADQGDWGTLFIQLPTSLWGDVNWFLVTLSLLVGSCWFMFLLKASQPRERWPLHVGLCLLAIVLGILSIWLTVFLIYWQEQGWGLVEGDNMISVVIYDIVGVGLREEFSKTLLFAPLVPLIARRDNGLLMLIVPACVGLGFAVEENMQYYSQTLMGAISGRFVTANIMHMMLTGLVGLELCWLWLEPRTRWQHFLGVFFLAVLLHGVYDAIIDVVEEEFLAMVGPFAILVLVIYQFFHMLRDYRRPEFRGVSLVFIYVLGVFLSIMVMVYSQSWLLGPAGAFKSLSADAMCLGLMSIVLLQQMPSVLTE